MTQTSLIGNSRRWRESGPADRRERGRQLRVFCVQTGAGRHDHRFPARGQGDVVNLRKIGTDSTAKGNQDFVLIGDTAFSGTAGELRSWTAKGDTYVVSDINDDGSADFKITLDGKLTLTDRDFLL